MYRHGTLGLLREVIPPNPVNSYLGKRRRGRELKKEKGKKVS
jgi:hypothetical protein